MIPCDRCPKHPWAVIFEDETAGDLICTECGLVVGDRLIDMSNEWKTVKPLKKDPNRVGHAQNPLLSDANLRTSIAPPINQRSTTTTTTTTTKKKNSGGSSKLVENPDRTKMSHRDRTLINAFENIKEMANRLRASQSTSDLARNLFAKVKKHKSGKGYSHDTLVSTCLLIACRLEGVPRTIKETSNVSKATRIEIARCLKKVIQILEIKTPLTTFGDLLGRFTTILGLPYNVEKMAAHICSKADELSLIPGCAPNVLAAVAIYMASKELGYSKTPDQVQEATGVGDDNIEKRYTLFKSRTAELLPNDIYVGTPIEKCGSMEWKNKHKFFNLRAAELLSSSRTVAKSK